MVKFRYLPKVFHAFFYEMNFSSKKIQVLNTCLLESHENEILKCQLVDVELTKTYNASMAQAMLTSFLDSNSEDKLKCVIKIIRTTDDTLHVKVFKNVSHRSIF